MEEYISKSALVAKVKSRIDINETCQKISGDNEFYHGAIDEAKGILSIINTLEVKEVDLEKEIDRIDDSVPGKREDIEYIAKHFFELGLKAQKGE